MLITAAIAFAGLQMASTTPADKMSTQWWKDRHERCVAITKAGGFNVAFVGDSITQGWESNGAAAWKRDFEPLGAANFGFSGDQTQHVLWRLQNGEMIAAKPKVAVIMIGTNNIGNGNGNPEQTAEGVKAIVKLINEKSPESKILLLGIFPRARNANDLPRTAVAKATDGFKGIADGQRVHFKDIGKFFIRSTGELRDTLMPDLLHLSPGGYDIWAKAIKDDVLRLLNP